MKSPGDLGSSVGTPYNYLTISQHGVQVVGGLLAGRILLA